MRPEILLDAKKRAIRELAELNERLERVIAILGGEDE